MGDNIKFGCGEFIPGGKPIDVGGIIPPIPPVYHPEPPKPDTPDIPVIPEPPVGGGGGGGNPGGPGGGSGNPGNPGNPQNPANPSGGVKPGSTGGSGNPQGTGGPSTHAGQKYKCTSVAFYCPQDLLKPLSERRIKEVRRFCTVCQPVVGPGGILAYQNDCVYQSKIECEAHCVNSLGLNNCIEDPITDTGQNQDQQNQDNQGSGQGRPTDNVDVKNQVDSEEPIDPHNPTDPQIFDHRYNIFKYPIVNDQTVVNNDVRLDVFAPIVNAEVKYLIDMQTSDETWDEYYIFNLTNQKILNSLNPQLKTAFEVIHWPGGQLVGPMYFVEGLKKHLLTGTLSEFDSGFFFGLQERQLNDYRVRFSNTSNREANQRLALGLIARDAVIASTSGKESIELSQIRRQRRLYEDILARIPICPLNSDQEDLSLSNFGVCLTTYEDDSKHLDLGDGYGYYFYLNTLNAGCNPFETTNEIERTLYISPETRFNALTLFGADPKAIITSNSLDSQNEFTVSDSGVADLSPMYLKLELSSLTNSPTNDPFIYRLSCNYSVISDQNEIDEHTKNNGFAVSRLNLDYRDPLFRYIKDSSSMSFTQNDVTFLNFFDPGSPDGQYIFSRNMPFGFVVTPVKGSKYNPFNGFSKLQTSSTTVTRSLGLYPSFQYSDTEERKSELSEQNLYLTTGEYKVGDYESNDLQNYIHYYSSSAPNLVNSFISDGMYTSGESTVYSYGLNYLVKDVLDPLIAEHDPSALSWFDIYRRMPLRKFGEVLYDNHPQIMFDLSNGARNDVKIKHILKTVKDQSDRILADDDMTVIRLEDRTYAINSKAR